jgi:putative aldouronate transport system permease protein
MQISDVAKQAMSHSSKPVFTQSFQMAAIVVAVMPILAVYPFLQKYFVKGIMIGSIKE